MATVEEAIVTRLKAVAAVTALVGTRIYINQLPQMPTLPAVVYNRISGNRVNSLQGSGGLASPVFQFDVFGTSATQCRQIVRELQTALAGYRGTVAGVNIQAILFLGDYDAPTGDQENLADEQSRVIAEFKVWHLE